MGGEGCWGVGVGKLGVGGGRFTGCGAMGWTEHLTSYEAEGNTDADAPSYFLRNKELTLVWVESQTRRRGPKSSG